MGGVLIGDKPKGGLKQTACCFRRRFEMLTSGKAATGQLCAALLVLSQQGPHKGPNFPQVLNGP